jgi:hypothetical protein
MKCVLARTTYLEMLSPPTAAPAPSPAGTRIERLREPTLATYRHLYNGVGGAYNWVDRNLMPDDALLRIITDELVEIDVLYSGNQTAGYVELDRRTPGEIELAYFGLFPNFIGRGLGKYFLSWALVRAWSLQPRRVWVHTCDLDHVAALPNYMQACFAIYEEKFVEQMVPEE